MRATATPRDGTTRVYRLTGLVRCGVCDRRMVGHWVRGRATGIAWADHGELARPGSPKWLYARDDRLLERVAVELGRALGPGGADDAAAYLRASRTQLIGGRMASIAWLTCRQGGAPLP